MAEIVPTVTAFDLHQYNDQIKHIAGVSERVHIDLMDGILAPTKSPPIDKIWLPYHQQADIHLMYQQPMDHIRELIKLRPRMVVVHAEAHVHHMHFVAELHKMDILAGLAILQDTPVENIHQIMHSFDHILVFSGNLGHHGGTADLGILDKVTQIRREFDDVEIGWDGGINADNCKQLVDAGVDVLNVGSFIQSSDSPEKAYQQLTDALL